MASTAIENPSQVFSRFESTAKNWASGPETLTLGVAGRSPTFVRVHHLAA